ncbi:hypothetical protein GHA01_28610 [Novacetimonas hansenii]|uniref:Uncharacterized protein n=1 Tax=Novacetimonas hansenii TaxID=436 RepID=A0ABQ0SK81_NOVHA|nr:hypothetical protein Gaha_0248_004 [Novacetimonas hansenii JCM 7643]GEC65012.1 hypothetical protein GHA01_28610 [Novacetimonas hansenii]
MQTSHQAFAEFGAITRIPIIIASQYRYNYFLKYNKMGIFFIDLPQMPRIFKMHTVYLQNTYKITFYDFIAWLACMAEAS